MSPYERVNGQVAEADRATAARRQEMLQAEAEQKKAERLAQLIFTRAVLTEWLADEESWLHPDLYRGALQVHQEWAEQHWAKEQSE